MANDDVNRIPSGEKIMSNVEVNLFGVRPGSRVYAFIDGSNHYACARGLNVDIDYKAQLECLMEDCNLVRAFYYTALLENDEFSSLRPLVDWLDYNGYSVVTKPAKEFTDAMGRRKIKGNMDIELAIGMMKAIPYMEHAILFSGDGDFRTLVEEVQNQGIRVTVVSSSKTQPSMIADELRRQADVFVDLDDVIEHFERTRQ